MKVTVLPLLKYIQRPHCYRDRSKIDEATLAPHCLVSPYTILLFG
jgi:hypothetical protein